MALSEREILYWIDKQGKDGWARVAIRFILTEEFVEKYKNKLDLYSVFKHQYFSEEFIKKYRDFNILDNRFFSHCYWCKTRNKVAEYNVNTKAIKHLYERKYYYCSICLR